MNLSIFQWRTLKTRVTLFTIVICLVGIWSLTFYAGHTFRSNMERILGEQQFSTVSVVASEIDGELGTRTNAVETVAKLIKPAHMTNASSLQIFLERYQVLALMFNAGIVICDTNGIAIAEYPNTGRAGNNYSHRDWIIEALKGKTTIGNPVVGKNLQAPVFTIATPIRHNGKVVGVLAGAIDLSKSNFLSRTIDNSYGKRGGYLLVAPKIRTIVYATDKKRIMEVLPSPGVNPLIDRNSQGYEGSVILVNPLGAEVLTSIKKIPASGWALVALVPTEDVFDPIHVMQRRMLFAAFFLTLVVGGVTWWMLRRQLAPIFTTIKTLITLSGTDISAHLLPITRKDEIGELIGGFNHLLEALMQRGAALRESEGTARRLAQENELIAEIGRIVSSTLNIQDVYDGFARKVREIIPFDRITVNTINRKDCTRTVRYVFGNAFLHAKIGETLPYFRTPTEEMSLTKSSLLANSKNWEEMKRKFPETRSLQVGHGTAMFIPLISNNETIAILSLHSIETDVYNENHLRLAERIGNQIASAIANAQLYFECKHSEEALQESEIKFRGIAEQTIVGISIIQDGILQYVNLKYAQMHDYGVEDMIGMSYVEAIYPDDVALVEGFVGKRLSGEIGSSHYECRKIKKNGELFYVDVYGVSTLYKHRPAVIGVLMDITERKRAEEENLSLQERLQRSEKMEALGTLAGGVAHDLNNVLGIVVGYAEMILDSVETSNPIKRNLENVMNAGMKAAAIVEDLLTLARRGVQGRNILNINKIIADNLKSPEFTNLSICHPSVKIITNLEPDLLNISGSSIHLGKTLYNLLSNACEAMPTGGIVTIKTINQYLDTPLQGYDHIQGGDYVVLSVSDKGEGISTHDLKRIFEPFYTKKIMGRSGTGLGLAVVWGTVKDHNGYINVRSEEGNGSTFSLYFPVAREVITPEAAAIAVSEYMGKGESILVVDDVKEQRDLATSLLSALNYHVSGVSSGEEAMAYLKEHEVDLMVLDMIMDTGMDGLDTYKSILNIRPNQKAIIVSGFSESDRVKAAINLGAGAYVRKPYIREKLGMAVRKELDRK